MSLTLPSLSGIVLTLLIISFLYYNTLIRHEEASVRHPQKFRFVTTIVALLCILALSLPAPVFGQQTDEKDDDTSNEQQVPAEKKEYPKKLEAKENWEKIINIPAQIIYFPIWILFKGVKSVIAVGERTELVAKVLDFLESDDGRRGIYPTYTSQTGGGPKFFCKDLITPGSELKLSATAGLYWSWKFKFAFEGLRIKGPLSFDIMAQYRNLTAENFFGIGNQSYYGDETSYGWRQTMIQGTLNLDLGSRSHIKATLGFDHNSFTDGKDPNVPSTLSLPPGLIADIHGLETSTNLFHAYLQYQIDSRNRLGNPSGGWELQVSGGIFSQFGGDYYRFMKSSVDAKRYFHLFYERSFMLRAAAEITRPLGDGKIPFYYLSELGKRRTIRGFRRGRFRDRDMALFSFEYRYPLIKRPGDMINVDAILFLDWGKVASNIFKDSLLKDYHWGFGGGFRVFTVKGIHVQLLAGKSRDKFRIYLVINEE